jgi:hypothetical protein
MDDLGFAHRLSQHLPGACEGGAHAHDRGVHGAHRDRDPEHLPGRLGHLAAGEAKDPGQGRDVGFQARPERRGRDPLGQPGEGRLAATRAAQAQEAVLVDQRAGGRQLPLLVGHRVADALLGALEAVPAARAALGRVLEGLIHPLRRRHLAV